MKKIASIVGVLLIIIFLLSACADGYKYQEGDIVLTVSVDKTAISIGDTVELTAELKNLSGRSLSIWFRNSKRSLEGAIYPAVALDENCVGGVVYDIPYREDHEKFSKNTFVVMKESYTITEDYFTDDNLVDLFAGAIAEFYIGKIDSDNKVFIKSNVVRITIV